MPVEAGGGPWQLVWQPPETRPCLRCGKRKCLHSRIDRHGSKVLIPKTQTKLRVTRLPWCAETSLTARLVTWIDATQSRHMWGGLAPQYIGHDPAADSAALAVCEAQQYFVIDNAVNPVSLERAFKLYGYALSMLQRLLSDPKTATSDAALVTVALLSTFESYLVRRRKDRGDTRTHWAGITAILAARPKSHKPSQLTRAVLYDFHDATYIVPSVLGIPSPFEEERFFDIDPPEMDNLPPEARKMQRLRHEIGIRAPRLAVYVREIRDMDADLRATFLSPAARKALALAQYLLLLEDVEAETAYLHKVKLTPNKDEDGKSLVPYMMTFTSYAHHRVGALYWTFLLVTLNLALELTALLPAEQHNLDAAQISSKQERFAANLMMCWQYSNAGGTFRTLEMHHPYMTIWGSLRRRDTFRGKPVNAVKAWLMPKIQNPFIEWTTDLSPAKVDVVAYGLMGDAFEKFKDVVEEADWRTNVADAKDEDG